MNRVAARARLTRPYWRHRFHSFGEDSILHRPDWVYGSHQVDIGARTIMLGHLWLSVERIAWTAESPVITIGDGVGVRPYCTISAGESIVIEDDVVLSAFTSVIDSDHTYDDGFHSVLWNRLVTSPIRIGRGTWVGERAAVLRGSQIGRYCFIGANSVVKGEIPDYSVAVGAPARVIGSTRDRAPG
jgi:acetyltransferase-like isoleucine patch superfamily enzyme